MLRLFLFVALTLFTMIIRAQSPAEPAAEDKERLGPPVASNSVWLSGTVRYVPLEGGFYGILGDDGKRYDPIALNPKFAHDGLRVKLQARLLTSALSLRMWGTPIKIIEIGAEASAGEDADDE